MGHASYGNNTPFFFNLQDFKLRNAIPTAQAVLAVTVTTPLPLSYFLNSVVNLFLMCQC